MQSLATERAIEAIPYPGGIFIPNKESIPEERQNAGRRTAPAQPKGVNVECDVLQLINPVLQYRVKPVTPSILPKPYIPPSFRKGLESRAEHKRVSTAMIPMTKTDVDVFNSNIADTLAPSHDGAIRPAVGGKKEFWKTTGSFKSKSSVIMSSAKKASRQKHDYRIATQKTKLPPPPIGSSIGHGIIQP